MSNRKRGRPKGSLNKVTNEVKAAILEVFEKMGGVQGMYEWATSSEENKTIFYTKIYPKLLPRPALDVVATPEPVAATGGVFTWRTPAWAKKVEKEQFRKGIAMVGRPDGSGGPRRSGEPLGDEADEPG